MSRYDALFELNEAKKTIAIIKIVIVFKLNIFFFEIKLEVWF